MGCEFDSEGEKCVSREEGEVSRQTGCHTVREEKRRKGQGQGQGQAALTSGNRKCPAACVKREDATVAVAGNSYVTNHSLHGIGFTQFA